MAGAARSGRQGPLHAVAAFLAVVGVAAGAFLPSLRSEFAGVMTANLLVLILGLCWLARAATAPRADGAMRPVVVRDGPALPLLAFLGWNGVALAASRYAWPGLVSLTLWGGAAVFFLVLTQLLRGAEERRLIVAVLLASAAVVALHGLHQKFVELPALRALYLDDPEAFMRRTHLPPDLARDMAGRLGLEDGRTKDRVFSTFLQPTTLSGYLAMLLPFFAAAAVGGVRRGGRAAAGGALALAAGCAATWCLYETRSKGGWLALGAAAAVLAAAGGWRAVRRMRRPWTVAGIAAALLLVAAGSLLAMSPRRLEEAVGSFAVRAGFWRAAALMARDRPLTGVGPGNFEFAYPQYKRAMDQDAKDAHNDYAQIAAEAGLPALAAYIWFWIACLRRVARGAGGGPSPPQASAPPQDAGGGLDRRGALLVGLAGGIVAFALEMRYGLTFASSDAEGLGFFLWPLALWAVWSALVAAGVLLLGAPDGPLVRVAVAAGLAAFLARSTMDFDLQVPGVRLAALTLAALGTSLAPRRARPLRWSSGRLAAAAIAALAAQAALWAGFVRPACQAQELYDRARLMSAGEIEPDAEKERSLIEGAARADRWNAEYPGALADFDLHLARSASSPALAASHVRGALASARRAAELNPLAALNAARMGRARLALAALTADPSARLTLLEAARIDFRRAVALHPSSALLRVELGQASEALGRRGEAAAAYRSALDLSERQYALVNKIPEAGKDALRRRITELESP